MVKASQLINAPSSMTITLFGMEMLIIELKLNADVPIVVTVLGIITVVRLLPENAPLPISAVPSGITYSVDSDIQG